MKNESKKVTYFLDGFPVLSQTFVLNQITSLLQTGVDVDIISMAEIDAGKEHPWVKQYDMMSKTRYVMSGNSRWSKLLGLIVSLMSDVFSFSWYRLSWLFKSGIKGYLIGRKFEGVEGPVVCHFGPVGAVLAKLIKEKVISEKIDIYTVFHGYDLSIYEEVAREEKGYKSLFEVGALMLPISEFWKDKLVAMGCSSEKIITHRMGVDIQDFDFVDRYAKSGKSTVDIVNLICVCRFVEKKGLPVLIKAINNLPENYKLSLIGSGPLEDEIRSLVEAYKLADRVNFLGPMPSDKVAEQLKKSDGLVLPSVTAKNGDMEGIPVTLMEAMASGLLVFSTVHSGIPELIKHEESGFLSEEWDDEELACNIVNAFEHLGCLERANVAQKARRTVENNFNIHELNARLKGIIFSNEEPM